MSSIAPTATISLIDIRAISLEQCLPLAIHLSSSEQMRFERIVREQRKVQFLIGRMLLRQAVSLLMHCEIDAISVIERERQAPILQLAGSQPVPFFSISHTGNWVACALSPDVEIGLDIEQYNANRDLEAIAKHTFQPDDLSWFQQQPDRVAAFYRLWSIKEARFKLTQNYTILPFEHYYELPHHEVTVVLMTALGLVRAPECVTVAFTKLKDSLQLNSK